MAVIVLGRPSIGCKEAHHERFRDHSPRAGPPGGASGPARSSGVAWPRPSRSGRPPRPAPATGLPGLRVGPEIYQSIGVRPFVNARGTYTILTGSTMLPEVRAAMDAAAQHYVHLDELAEAIGQRLAELTRAEWGMVTTGCAAALTHATAACVTGGNPDLHVRVPDLRGFPKDECIIPRHSRNVYDAAVRAVGVRVVEVETAEELEAAFGPRTALVYVLAGPNADEGPLRTKAICEAAKKRGVPVLVDAAAEILTVPERPPAARRRPRHLQRRQVPARPADRRPAARPQGPGEGGLGGQRAAPRLRPRVQGRQGRGDGDAGRRRDVDEARLRGRDPGRGPPGSTRSRGASPPIAGVTTSVTPAEGLSNRMPLLQIRWDRAKLGTTGEAVAKLLFESEPRISLFPARGRLEGSETGLTIGPYMMAPGDEKVVADAALRRALEAAAASRRSRTAPAGDGPDRHLGRADRVRGQRLDSPAAPAAARATTSTAPTRATSCRATCGARSTATRCGSAAPGSTATRSTTRSAAGSPATRCPGEVDLGEYLDARFSAKRHASGRA